MVKKEPAEWKPTPDLPYSKRIRLIQHQAATTGPEVSWKDAQAMYRHFIPQGGTAFSALFPAMWLPMTAIWHQKWVEQQQTKSKYAKAARLAQSVAVAHAAIDLAARDPGEPPSGEPLAELALHVNGETIPLDHIGLAKWFIKQVGSPEAALRVLRLLVK